MDINRTPANSPADCGQPLSWPPAGAGGLARLFLVTHDSAHWLTEAGNILRALLNKLRHIHWNNTPRTLPRSGLLSVENIYSVDNKHERFAGVISRVWSIRVTVVLSLTLSQGQACQFGHQKKSWTSAWYRNYLTLTADLALLPTILNFTSYRFIWREKIGHVLRTSVDM